MINITATIPENSKVKSPAMPIPATSINEKTIIGIAFLSLG
jgi:hypothetical protein